jgi:alkylation response protein AidB-like acyl-CoA dehydrogenase
LIEKPSLYLDEHVAFRNSVRQFVARELAPRAEEFRASRQIDRSVWKRAGDLGFLGFMMSAEFGGGGTQDFRFNAILGQELARLGYAYASSFGINVDVVSPYLLELTTEAQKDRWLPAFCAGELITAMALTEPGAGSDLAAVATRAERTSGGWTISGSKTFITNGSACDLALVLARTGGPGARGLSLFAVESGATGFVKGRKLDKLGQHEVDTSELFFDDVVVGDDALIGVEGAAFGYLMRNLAQERLSCAVAAHAHAEQAFAVSLAYAKNRKAFGSAIGSFQHNKFELATARADLDVAAAFLENCIWDHLGHKLDPVDAAKAKYWATEVQNRVVDLGLQLFGGYGYMRESEIANAWVDARVTRIFAGTNEIMREVIGRSLGL